MSRRKKNGLYLEVKGTNKFIVHWNHGKWKVVSGNDSRMLHSVIGWRTKDDNRTEFLLPEELLL